MKGAEGQLFRPMAETYAFALAGALLLAVTIAPVLCLLLFRNLKPAQDNWLVRYLKRGYLRQLERLLNHRRLAVGGFAGLIVVTAIATATAWAESSFHRSKKDTSGSAACFRSAFRSTRPPSRRGSPARSCANIPRSNPSPANWGGPIPASIRRASTAPSFSCRSSSSPIGRKVVEGGGWFGANACTHQARAGCRNERRAERGDSRASIGTSRR